MEALDYSLAIAGGLAAGFINTLAGSGSLITLPILIFLGLPAPIANATNRVGIIVQTLVAVFTLSRQGNFRIGSSTPYVFPSVLGAIVGAFIALQIDEKALQTTIGVVLLIMLIPILLKPRQWLKERSDPNTGLSGLVAFVVFFAIGIYGGFLQAGVGIFLLIGLVLLVNYNLTDANAIKNFVVCCYTIPACLVFAWNDQIDWYLGGLMAIGQAIGAFLASYFALRYSRAQVWTRRLLIFVVLVSGAELLGFREWLFQWLGF